MLLIISHYIFFALPLLTRTQWKANLWLVALPQSVEKGRMILCEQDQWTRNINTQNRVVMSHLFTIQLEGHSCCCWVSETGLFFFRTNLHKKIYTTHRTLTFFLSQFNLSGFALKNGNIIFLFFFFLFFEVPTYIKIMRQINKRAYGCWVSEWRKFNLNSICASSSYELRHE